MLDFLDWALFNKENANLVFNGIENVTYVEDDDGFIELPQGYASKVGISSPSDIFGRMMIGGNADYNTNWYAKSTPPESMKAYNESLTMPISKIYVPPTAYTAAILDDLTELQRSVADSNWDNALQALIKNKTISNAEFDTAYQTMLNKYVTDGGTKAYTEYTRIYNLLYQNNN